MADLDEVRKCLFKFLNKKKEDPIFTKEHIEKLLECGLLTEKPSLRYIIKSEYFELIRGSDMTGNDAIMDLSIRWNVSSCFITNLLYRNTYLRV